MPFDVGGPAVEGVRKPIHVGGARTSHAELVGSHRAHMLSDRLRYHVFGTGHGKH